MKIKRNSILSAVLFALMMATLMALEEFYEGEMTATTVVEEIAAYLSILGVLFLTIVAPFHRYIEWISRKHSWKEHFMIRLGIGALIIITLSSVLGFVFGEVIHHYIDHSLPTGVVVLRTILFLLTMSSIIMALLELRIINEEREELTLHSERLEKENIETLYNSLKQQVNPHFLFNSLSVLSSLIQYDPKKAELFVEHFSDIYRYVLDMNKHTLVSVDRELSFLDSYLFLQRIRFGDHILLNNNISDEDGQMKIPPLSLQLVFENILKHNAITEEHPITITLHTDKDRLSITNTIRPRQHEPESGHLGNKNIKEKYRLLGAEKPTFITKENKYEVVLPLFKPSTDL